MVIDCAHERMAYMADQTIDWAGLTNIGWQGMKVSWWQYYALKPCFESQI
jgi:hypothetical protein